MSRVLIVISVAVLAVVVLLVVAAASLWTPDRPLEALKARWATPPSQFIDLDGMQVHVRDEGPRGDPTPIVLLHGTGSSLQTWQGWVDNLKGEHRVISLDRPGSGLTGPNPSGDYSMAYYAGFLDRLLDRLHVERAIVVGNSSGGYMAWRFAAAYPARVARLVLISPGGYPRSTPLPSGLRMAMSPAMSPILQHILPKSQVWKSARASYGDPSKVTPATVERLYEMALRPGNRKAVGQALRASYGNEKPEMINTVKAPTLILWGTKDTTIPPHPAAEAFHQRIAGSTLVMLPGDGHVSQEEDPQGTVAAFKAWSAGLDKAAGRSTAAS